MQVLSTDTHTLQYIEEEIQRYTTLSYRAPEMVDLYSGRPIGKLVLLPSSLKFQKKGYENSLAIHFYFGDDYKYLGLKLTILVIKRSFSASFAIGHRSRSLLQSHRGDFSHLNC